MKKLLSVLVALTLALSLATLALAETKAEPAKKTEAKKAKSHQITGIVEAVDGASGKLTVKGRTDTVNLKAGDEVDLAKIQVGDKVLVKYSGDTAASVKKVSGKKAEPKKTAKKKIVPAEPVAAPAGK